jgi:hypothetical protein
VGPIARRCLTALAPVAAFVVARGALLRVTWALPVSNDDAILLLMGRHLLRGELATILWNQPYNGALDAYLLAPGLAFGPAHAVYRLYQLACAALLVFLLGALARHVGGAPAGLAAGLLAAWGTPYMALMTATGPPPNFLMPLVTGLPLLVGLRAHGGEGRGFSPVALAGSGLVAGLAIWNSSLAIPAFVGMAAGGLAAGARPSSRSTVAFAVGTSLGMSPLAVARLVGASGSRVVTAASAVTSLRPRWLWGEGLADLAHALRGLVGLQVPLVVDGPERAGLPMVFVLALGAGLVIAVTLGATSRRAWPLVGWAGALGGAFWLSRRTGPDELRYLYGLNAPLLVLAGIGLARAWGWRRSAGLAVGLAILLPWGLGERILAAVWRDPAHAARVWQVPPLDATLACLRQRGLKSAYASLQFAGRITLESEGEVIASQAWNERIPGDPLRFRDEVDLDPDPAWALSPILSRGMPRAAGFRELLQGLGGSWHEVPAGPLVVFYGFEPPYDESRAVPVSDLSVRTDSGASLGDAVVDRDPATAWVADEGLAPGRGVSVALRPPRRLSALVFLVDLERSPLAVPWVASIEGEIVAQGPARAGFQWVNGAPRAGKQGLLVVPLRGREAGEVSVVFQGRGPRLSLAEVFAYGPDETRQLDAGAAAAEAAFAAARAGRWDEAVRLYERALRADPDRASRHADWLRARWRAAGRRWLDVESLDDGGPELVGVR